MSDQMVGFRQASGLREALRKYWASLDWVEELLYLSVLATEAALIAPWQLLIHNALG